MNSDYTCGYLINISRLDEAIFSIIIRYGFWVSSYDEKMNLD